MFSSKKIIIAFLFIPYLLTAQDTIIINHKYYKSTYIKSKHIPLLVEYFLTREMLICDTPIQRLNEFVSDPELNNTINLNDDYYNSGYDRGHNISAKNNGCDSVGMKESFFFSNIFPQTHCLNAGVWKTLEKQERAAAIKHQKVKVFIGSLGEIGKLGKDSLTIPEFCWKVIYIEDTGLYECFIMPNRKEGMECYEDFKTDLVEIENKSGIRFQKDSAIIKINQYPIKRKTN